ncbi:hypothetical protein J4573_17250 [Actinomadura barringtoniae]|uniref:Uncharacterized protein n=1 Tax=Actinomadura barringtoniae TaxID=1427535 RepID=A0A939T4Y5_9ACTN|nr:hypothetical protein [Actinomadura barringtoniae]MBO2448854.1 hypothetical protein [Actinomadura barringtoniae]
MERHEIREQLRSVAGEGRPDRDRIWARIEAGMAETVPAPQSRTRAWPRMAMAALATVAVMVLASGVAWQLTGRNEAPPAAPASTSTSTPSSPASAPPRAPVNRSWAVTASVDPNSNAYWAQNTLVLKVKHKLTGLAVTIRVARTANVAATASWLSLPASDFRISTDTTASEVIYRWTLLPGRTIRPGSYTLAAQYNRGAGHDPRQDAYSVRSDGDLSAGGHF